MKIVMHKMIVVSGDKIEVKELETTLKVTKKKKGNGLDGTNAEIFKYGGMLFKFCLLHFLSMFWKNCLVPME